jgi:hypothetical protein
MNNTIYKSPDWLYKPANLNSELMNDMQNELLNYVTDKTGGDWANLNHIFYVYYSRPELYKYCPTVKKQFDELSLTELYYGITFTIFNPNSRVFPIHIDYPNPARLSLALTIPILNCEGSYTAWYDAEILPYKVLDKSYVMNPVIATTLLCDQDTAVEIDRVTSEIPHWINVGKMHKGVSTVTDRPRILATLRFLPNIFEYIADGRFDQILVKN